MIERHHSDDAEVEVALVRLADMLAHYAQGALGRSATSCSRSPATSASGRTSCARSSTTCPIPTRGGRARQIDPCPLSTREMEVLKRLAEGKVYKQIAHELALSTSTVRTHLHNIYGKLGAVDRAQAVLVATERGWI